MTRIMNIGRITITIFKYTLIGLVLWYLIAQGMHPAWAVVLFVFRKAAFKVCIALAILYWITAPLM